MADRIKGITIELNGDTTGLSDSLKKVDSAIKDTQANLRDLNKLLRLDPGNTELLEQKQKNLTTAIEETKNRLEQLKNAQGNVAEGTAEWDALQREIIDTEQSLKKLEDQYKQFGSVAEQQIRVAADKLKDFGDKTKQVGDNLTKSITVPIAAIGGASVMAFKEVDAALDTVTTKTGATGEALEQMQDSVKNIATNMPTDFQTAADAVGEVNTRFGLTGEELEKLSEQFVKFAQINGTDVSGSIDKTQAAMAAFNVDTQDAAKVLDVLNKAGQDTGVSVDTLTDDLTKNATAMKEMGFNLSDSAVFLANLNKNGINASEVMAGLKKALVNATKDGQSMNEAMVELQEGLAGAATDTDAYALAMELFGNKAGPAIADAVKDGRLSFEEFGSSLDSFAGNLSSTFEETQDPIDKTTQILNELKLTGAELVEAAGPVITDVLGTLREVVQGLREAWEGLSPAQQEFIVKAALIAAAIGPIVSVIGTVISTIGTIMSVLAPIITFITGVVIPAIAAVSAAIGAPVAVVVAAGVAIVAAVTYVWTHWEQISGLIIDAWEKVTGFFSSAAEAISNVLSNLGSFISEKWTAIKEGVINAATNIKEKASEKWSQLKENVSTGLSNLKDTVSEKWNAISEKVQTTSESIKSKATTAFTNMKTSIANTVGGIRDKIVEGFKAAISFITGLPQQALQWGRDIIQGIINGITEKFEALKKKAAEIAGAIKDFIGFSEPEEGPLSDFHTYMPDMIELMTKGITQGIPEVQRAMNQLTNTMVPPMQTAQEVAVGSTNTTNSVNITVYGAAGQNVNELANIIEQRIADNVVRRGAAFA